ncbi:hypothetical protein [Persephonella sp.]|uniref:hypothetical protein n=1 Tax=Persephonella sp. TaxID=2060922 RepID=UPI0026052FB1|nr:hypothetical protein [Persephonella sp.]
MIAEIRQKILRKNGHEAVFIKLSVVAKVLGFASSDPVIDIADKEGIQILKVNKYRVIRKDDLDNLLRAIIKERV